MHRVGIRGTRGRKKEEEEEEEEEEVVCDKW